MTEPATPTAARPAPMILAPSPEHDLAEADAREAARLEAVWARAPGVVGWLTEVNHKAIGVRFVVTAFAFFALGGVEAAVMRIQLARPELGVVSADFYDQLFTTHGTTMMFLFAVPVMEGLGSYFVPLMIGTRNLAFPRLNAFSYWTFLFSGLLLYGAFLFDIGPDAGWFAYVPLSGPEFSPGKRVDVWSQVISLSELSMLAGAVNLISTILRMRAPGMSLNRMPLFVWAMLVTSFMVVFAMPAVMLASTCLSLDRLIGTHFFNLAEGGDPILWQHLFWFFAHPEVYIIFLPALGMVSTILAASARRAVFGYLPIVLSNVATGFIGFGVWVHHMFATGLPRIGEGFFSAASVLITIPTGVQFFCWIATIATGRVRFTTPMLYVLGFLGLFLIGGLSGVMLASVPIDLQVHDTFFVVAHLHYVLIAGAVFPLLGAVHHWLPKMTGRMPSEAAGKAAFALVFVGFNLTFFPMHVLGLLGQPRRVYTYLPETGWGDLNLLATIGVAVLAVGLLVYLGNVVWCVERGPRASADPWAAESLEWATSSPPPRYDFLYLPTVSGRSALWEAAPDQPVVVGMTSDHPEVLATTLMDAQPDHRIEHPTRAWAPLALALSALLGFGSLMISPWALVIGPALALASLLGWFWPERPHVELAKEQP